MRFRSPWIPAALVALALIVPGCTSGSADGSAEGGTPLATVEPIDGTDVALVTLSEEAADRIDVQTVAVVDASGTGDRSRTVIPYAAVLYDPSGATWTYTSPEPLVFVRAPIDIVRIQGDDALLSDGPPTGTQVVTVGAAELLGTEYEVGEE
ncbi:MAG TPA: hypothetical protein VFT27_11645 [Actinomycetota bacterium]|nr:hypothetical protein [Actinomycetota bacterium]